MGPATSCEKSEHVRAELEQLPRRLDDAAVAVDDVGDRVEGVERDTDGQHDVEHREVRFDAEGVRRIGRHTREESGVLEEAQQQQVHGDRHDQDDLAGVRRLVLQEREACEVTDERRERHQQAEARIPVAVEDVAGQREPDVPLVRVAQAPENART